MLYNWLPVLRLLLPANTHFPILLLSLPSFLQFMDCTSRASVIIVGAGVSGENRHRHCHRVSLLSIFRLLYTNFLKVSIGRPIILIFFFSPFERKVSVRRRSWPRMASMTSLSWRLPTVSAVGSGRKISEDCRWSSAPVGSPESVVKSRIRFGNSPPN